MPAAILKLNEKAPEGAVCASCQNGTLKSVRMTPGETKGRMSVSTDFQAAFYCTNENCKNRYMLTVAYLYGSGVTEPEPARATEEVAAE